MKKKLVWIVLIVILVLLITRSVTNHVDNVREERQWYIHELAFEFSAAVDSVVPPGKVLFHVTAGNLDRSKEKRIGENLRHNGMLDLFLYWPHDQTELMIKGAEQLHPGDSIYLNSVKNIVRIYRNKELLIESDLLNSLRGRPF